MIKTDEEAINRLRQSREETAKERGEQGREDGRSWAADDATAEELEALASLEGWPHGTAQEAARRVASAVGDRDEDHQSVWSRLSGDNFSKLIKHKQYVLGFVEAAVEFWNRVKDEVLKTA